jgi:hypothetical protein
MPLLQIKNPQANFSAAMTFFVFVFTIEIKTRHVHSLIEPHGQKYDRISSNPTTTCISANIYVSNWEAKHPTVAGRYEV